MSGCSYCGSRGRVVTEAAESVERAERILNQMLDSVELQLAKEMPDAQRNQLILKFFGPISKRAEQAQIDDKMHEVRAEVLDHMDALRAALGITREDGTEDAAAIEARVAAQALAALPVDGS